MPTMTSSKACDLRDSAKCITPKTTATNFSKVISSKIRCLNFHIPTFIIIGLQISIILLKTFHNKIQVFDAYDVFSIKYFVRLCKEKNI